MDNPEISIWINKFQCSGKAEMLLDDNSKYAGIEYNIQIAPDEEKTTYADLSSPEEARQAIQEVEAKSEEFVKTLSGLSDEEKASQIHNWILEDAKYDSTVSIPNIRNIYGAIVQKECVCAGFAYAFKYLGDMAGLDSIIVTGTGITPNSFEAGPHAWNNISLDGEWSLVDLTWDCEGSPVYDESEDTYVMEDKIVTIKSYTFAYSTYSNEYLFKPLEETTETHVPSDNFEVPTS